MPTVSSMLGWRRAPGQMGHSPPTSEITCYVLLALRNIWRTFVRRTLTNKEGEGRSWNVGTVSVHKELTLLTRVPQIILGLGLACVSNSREC